MSPHRLVAIVSATALVGLFGLANRAEASNFRAPAAPKPVATKPAKATVESTSDIREKVWNASIDGCGGGSSSASVSSSDDSAW